ncbi:MAG: tol-pal system protein YbgF [Pseudomonadota bacterium]
MRLVAAATFTAVALFSSLAAAEDAAPATANDVAKLDQRIGKIERILENQVMLELLQRVESLQQELRELRGEIETQGFEVEAMRKRQRDLYLDTDRRLSELEITGGGSSSASASSSSNLSDGGDTASTVSSVASNVASTTASTLGSAPTTVDTGAGEAPTNPVASNLPPVDPVQEKAAYTQAFNYLKEGRYEGAINAFAEFLGEYPNGNYADNAQYWLGEANYVSRFFDEAINQFMQVVEKYPSSPKISDARLKIGYAYYELENWDAARGALTSLANDFPGTSVARLANKRLTRMQDEGH